MRERGHRRDEAGSSTSLRSVVPLATAVLLAMLTVIGVSMRSDASADAASSIRAAQLDAALYPLGQTYLRSFTATGQAALGLPMATDRDDIDQERTEQVVATLDQLDAIAQGDDEIGSLAGALADTIREHQADPDDGSLSHLWEDWTAFDEMASAGTRSRSEDWKPLTDLRTVALTPRLAVSDMVDAEYVRLEPTVPASSEDYFLTSMGYITAGDAGWLADDPGDPFSGEWVPRESVRRHLPEVEASLTTILTSRDAEAIVAIDRWVKDAAEGVIDPPPLTLDEATAVADRLDRALAPVVTRAIDQQIDIAGGQMARADRDRMLIALAGATAVLLCLSSQVVIARRRQHRLVALTETSETDELTGLTNRRGLERRVPGRLSDAARASHVVVQVDLDRFKAINDTHGHQAGDRVLRAFAERTRAVLDGMGRRIGDHELARIGGDEFLIVLHDCTAPRTELARLLAALKPRLREPVQVGDVRLELLVSGGVAMATGPVTFDELLTEADVALYQAKNDGERGFRLFDGRVLRDILHDFPAQARAGAVQAHLQPQVDLDTGSVVGYEALARWINGDHPPVPAAQWVTVVEQMGAGEVLFESMARSTAAAIERLGSRFAGRVWLNLSPSAVVGRDAAGAILTTLESVGLDPRRVGFELLESVQIADLDRAARNLDAIRAAGIEVVLDDFGRGFTPIGHLTALPISGIKLDRSLIADIDRRPEQGALVAAMVTVAESLNISLIAEGIETETELAALRSLGVRFGQGYLLGHPAPAGEFVDDTARRSAGVSPDAAPVDPSALTTSV